MYSHIDDPYEKIEEFSESSDKKARQRFRSKYTKRGRRKRRYSWGDLKLIGVVQKRVEKEVDRI